MINENTVEPAYQPQMGFAYDIPRMSAVNEFSSAQTNMGLSLMSKKNRGRVPLDPTFGGVTNGLLRYPGVPDDSSPGIYPMLAENNFVVGAFDAIKKRVTDVSAGYWKDPHFSSEHFFNDANLGNIYSDDEAAWLKKSKNQQQFHYRQTEIAKERKRIADLEKMSFGSSLLWGIVGGVTDPTSYIPIFGQAGKIANVAKTARGVSAAIRTGKGVGGAMRGFALAEAKHGFWVAAAEGAVLESAFQTMLYADRIDKESFSGGIPSIAITGAFSGLLGGAIRGIGAIPGSRVIADRQVVRLGYSNEAFNRMLSRIKVDESLGAMGTPNVRAVEEPLQPGGMGRGPGARRRLMFKDRALRRREAAERALGEYLIEMGLASTDGEARSYARTLLGVDPMWINPLGNRPSTIAARGIGDVWGASQRAADILGDGPTAERVKVQELQEKWRSEKPLAPGDERVSEIIEVIETEDQVDQILSGELGPRPGDENVSRIMKEATKGVLAEDVDRALMIQRIIGMIWQNKVPPSDAEIRAGEIFDAIKAEQRVDEIGIDQSSEAVQAEARAQGILDGSEIDLEPQTPAEARAEAIIAETLRGELRSEILTAIARSRADRVLKEVEDLRVKVEKLPPMQPKAAEKNPGKGKTPKGFGLAAVRKRVRDLSQKYKSLKEDLDDLVESGAIGAREDGTGQFESFGLHPDSLREFYEDGSPEWKKIARVIPIDDDYIAVSQDVDSQTLQNLFREILTGKKIDSYLESVLANGERLGRTYEGVGDVTPEMMIDALIYTQSVGKKSLVPMRLVALEDISDGSWFQIQGRWFQMETAEDGMRAAISDDGDVFIPLSLLQREVIPVDEGSVRIPSPNLAPAFRKPQYGVRVMESKADARRRAGLIGSLSRKINKELKKPKAEQDKAYLKALEAERKKLKEGGDIREEHVSAVNEQLRRTLNRPRQGIAPATPASVAQDPPVKSVTSKVKRYGGGKFQDIDFKTESDISLREYRSQAVEGLREARNRMDGSRLDPERDAPVIQRNEEEILDYLDQIDAIDRELEARAKERGEAIDNLPDNPRELGVLEASSEKRLADLAALIARRDKRLKDLEKRRDSGAITSDRFYELSPGLRSDLNSAVLDYHKEVSYLRDVQRKLARRRAELTTRPTGRDAAFAQLVADAKNGIVNWTTFVKNSFGKGLANLIRDTGERVAFRARIMGYMDEVIDVSIRTDIREFLLLDNVEKYAGKSVMEMDYAVYDQHSKTIYLNRKRLRDLWQSTDPRDHVIFLASPRLKIESSEEILKRGFELDLKQHLKSYEEFEDFVVLHEVAHQFAERHQRLLEAKANDDKIKDILSKANKGEPPKKTRGGKTNSHSFTKGYEAQTHWIAWQWLKGNEYHGPINRPDIHWGTYDAASPMPMHYSVPFSSKQKNGPVHSILMDWKAMGFRKVIRDALLKWGRWTSEPFRAMTSPSKVLRTVTHYLIDTPFYSTDGGPAGGTAQGRVGMLYSDPMKMVRRSSEKAFHEVSKGLDDTQRLSWEQFDERIFMAIARKGKDQTSDAYSKAVTEAAQRYGELNRLLFRRGEGVGLRQNVEIDGEDYYRRIYDYGQVNSESFLLMCVRNGATMDGALEIQKKILSNVESIGDGRIVGTEKRGVMQGRGDFMATIPVEELAPFLNRSAFETQYNAARTMGGEVELRIGLLEAGHELGVQDHGDMIKHVLRVDEEGNAVLDASGMEIYDVQFSWKPILSAMAKEFMQIGDSKGIAFDPDLISAGYKAEWAPGTELAEKFPDHAKRIARFTEDVLFSRISNKQVHSEGQFASEFFDKMVSTLQHTRDIPQHPDSWMEARLPALIKNATHTLIGGKLAISNLADFHRSVFEYGFKRTFNNEWGLWLKDLEAWSRRNEMTEAMGLALEDQRADVERMLRNVQEHYVPETRIERLAAKGASLMSRLNMMDKVANSHQRMFSSGVQGFIIETVPEYVAGTLAEPDVRRLNRLGINLDAAKRIKNAFDGGALKKTERGTSYVQKWEGEGFDDFVAAVRKGVYINQSVPNRTELFDFQVQGMTSTLFMYRNWTMAANNRLLASSLSNPDAAMMSGFLASIGLGALVTTVRAGVNNESESLPWNDPEQFLRLSIDNGGYLGLVGEANNIIARMTNGTVDFNPIGEGKPRYYEAQTALAAISGPIWLYPNFVTKTTPDLLNPTNFDRYDMERVRGMIPFANLFYIDGLWNLLMKGDDNGDPDE